MQILLLGFNLPSSLFYGISFDDITFRWEKVHLAERFYLLKLIILANLRKKLSYLSFDIHGNNSLEESLSRGYFDLDVL